jgi:hypothetical protein
MSYPCRIRTTALQFSNQKPPRYAGCHHCSRSELGSGNVKTWLPAPITVFVHAAMNLREPNACWSVPPSIELLTRLRTAVTAVYLLSE